MIDAIGTVEKPQTHPIAIELISRATAAQDGYAAHDLLTHAGCRDLLTETQTRELTALVEARALGRGTLPETLLTDLMAALSRAEESHRGHRHAATNARRTRCSPVTCVIEFANMGAPRSADLNPV